MSPQNKAFAGAVDLWRATMVEYLARAGVNGIVYMSKHLAERAVERNIDPIEALQLAAPVIKEFRQSTFNSREFLVSRGIISLAASIDVGPVTGKRRVVLKTIYDKVCNGDFDVVIKL